MQIVIGIDGSSGGDRALDLVIRQSWPEPVDLDLVEVVETEARLFGGPWPTISMAEATELERQLLDAATAVLATAAARVPAEGFTVTTEVVRGRPATALVDEARQRGADLLVMGSRGHGRLESLLLGSTSAEVIAHAPCPVLVARGLSLHRVLLAYDGSEPAATAAAVVEHWPVFSAAEVRVASVAEVAPWWAGLSAGVAEGAPLTEAAWTAAIEDSRRAVDQVAARLRGAGRDATGQLLEGQPAAELVNAAAAWPANVLVMGTHSRHGVAGFVLGSVARNVALHAATSVLVVPPTTVPLSSGALDGTSGAGDRREPVGTR